MLGVPQFIKILNHYFKTNIGMKISNSNQIRMYNQIINFRI